jgi:hypothetical protein
MTPTTLVAQAVLIYGAAFAMALLLLDSIMTLVSTIVAVDFTVAATTTGGI